MIIASVFITVVTVDLPFSDIHCLDYAVSSFQWVKFHWFEVSLFIADLITVTLLMNYVGNVIEKYDLPLILHLY